MGRAAKAFCSSEVFEDLDLGGRIGIYLSITFDIQYWFQVHGIVVRHIIYEIIPSSVYYPPTTIRSYYHIFYYIPYALFHIPVTIL